MQPNGSATVCFQASAGNRYIAGLSWAFNVDGVETTQGDGTLTRNWDGTYTYRPTRGYTGVDGFAYSVSDGRLSASASISLNVLASGGCWGGQSVMVAAGQQSYGWSSSSYGYIVVKRAGGDSDSVSDGSVAIDWQGSTEAAIGSSANVGGAWWNALIQDPLVLPVDLGQASGLTIKRVNCG